MCTTEALQVCARAFVAVVGSDFWSFKMLCGRPQLAASEPERSVSLRTSGDESCRAPTAGYATGHGLRSSFAGM